MIATTDAPDARAIEAAAILWAEAEARRVDLPVDSPYVDAQRVGFIDNMRRADAWLSVAKVAEDVVGAVGGFFAATGPLDLGYLVVAADRRGAGIGRSLIERAVARARDLGRTALLLTVHETNARARSVYQAAGWNPTGRTEMTPDRHEVLLEYRLDVAVTDSGTVARGS